MSVPDDPAAADSLLVDASPDAAVSFLDSCGEGCGWMAALIAVLAWGTFGVPLKLQAPVPVHFFVMQTYKTVVCFVTAWLVVLLGVKVQWTAWGILSGIFWVPGAAAGIYGIRQAGLAIAVGTWSSIQLTTSFLFGILVFAESVKSIGQTILAFLVLMMGLIGMSRYSDPSSSAQQSGNSYEPVAMHNNNELDDGNDLTLVVSNDTNPKTLKRSNSHNKKRLQVVEGNVPTSPPPPPPPSRMVPLEVDTTNLPLLSDDDNATTTPHHHHHEPNTVVLFGGRLLLTARQMGLVGAVINGAWGGLNLIPMHYAYQSTGLTGASYLISYASGSMLVCLWIWMGMFAYHAYQFVVSGNSSNKDLTVAQICTAAYTALPALHVHQLGLPGVLAGLFYSVGNFGSILAVAYLGQGIGFSACQGQLLVSGLWGVFYFQEVTGKATIVKWFASASLTVVGIIWLSYEHEGSGAGMHRRLLWSLFRLEHDPQ